MGQFTGIYVDLTYRHFHVQLRTRNQVCRTTKKFKKTFILATAVAQMVASSGIISCAERIEGSE